MNKNTSTVIGNGTGTGTVTGTDTGTNKRKRIGYFYVLFTNIAVLMLRCSKRARMNRMNKSDSERV